MSAYITTTLVNQLKNIIETHDVYDSVVALAIDVLIKQKTSLRAQHNIFKKWLLDGNKDWPLLCNVAIALGDSSDNMSALLQATGSSSLFVRRMAIIQSLRIARSREEAAHIGKLAINDPSSTVIDTLLYLMYGEWALTLDDLGLVVQPNDYCISIAMGYDNSLPSIQADYIRHVLVKSYDVVVETPLDFLTFLSGEYQRAATFLWQAEKSCFSNPSRYVSQLDLFHEELLYPIFVDKLGLKSTRQEVSQIETFNRIEMLYSKKKELGNFAAALMECRRLRANPETHSRLHNQLTETQAVTWQQRNVLKKKLRAGYQELADWLISGCP